MYIVRHTCTDIQVSRQVGSRPTGRPADEIGWTRTRGDGEVEIYPIALMGIFIGFAMVLVGSPPQHQDDKYVCTCVCAGVGVSGWAFRITTLADM